MLSLAWTGLMSRFISRGFAHPAIAGHVRRAGIVIAAAAAFTLCLVLPSSADGWVCQTDTVTNAVYSTYSASATWNYVFVWQSSTNAPAPQTATFKVVSSAGWTGGWQGQEPTWSADDGFGDQAVPLFYAEGGGNYGGTGYSSTGVRLIQKSGASGEVTFTAKLSVSVAGSCRVNQLGIGCTITPDSRALTLQRLNSTGDSSPSPGVTAGNTIFSTSPYSPIPFTNDQTIRSTLSGDWGVRSWWQWDPDDSWGSPIYDLVTVPTGTLYYDYNGDPQGPTDKPQVVKITYSCTDETDGATASAEYDLTAHDQVDDWQLVGFPFQITALDCGTYGPEGTGIPISYAIPTSGVNWTIIGQVGGGVLTGAGSYIAVAADVSPWVSAALAVAGYIVSVETPPSATTASVTPSESQFEQDFAAGNVSDAVWDAFCIYDCPLDTIYAGGYGKQLGAKLSLTQLQWQQNEVANSYNANGFAGQENGKIVTPGEVEYTYYWDFK